MSVLSGRPRPWGRVALISAVALVYFGAARFGLGFAVVAEQVTAVWPPSGIALAALLVFGSAAWPGVWLGALAVNVLAHEPAWTAAAIATGNTLEAVTGAWLLRQVRFHHSLDRVWDVMGLVGLAAGLSTTLAATVGATSLCLGGLQPWSAFRALWSVWWLGDAIGVLVAAPALLVWRGRPRRRWSSHRAAEAAALGIGLATATLATFGVRFTFPATSHQISYIVFPFLIWAALRFGQRGVSAAIVLVAGIAVAGTVRGYGPFAVAGAGQNLVMLQVFMAVAALTALLLGAAIAERNTAERRRMADYAVARAMASSATLEEAAPQILKAICECLEWDLGALWVVDAASGDLRCLEVWHGPGLAAPEFVAVTRARRFAPGVGLPGRVWRAGQPAWISDFARDTSYPRAPLARREGLHAAFGFPISLGDEVLGVIEFFSREIRRPDEALLQLFAILGSQIGQFIDRKRSEAAVRASEAELRRASEAKDHFLALLGHELRNPLAPIRNALEILRVRGAERSVAAPMHEMMERQTAHMVRLVDVEMHGGTVTASSEGPGRGSEFVVRLPCVPAQEPAPPPAPPAPPPSAARHRRVLVVDDNVDSAESLATLLQLAGHAVWMAHDGPSALAAAREHRPELVLLDIGLPAGMDGYEVA